MFNEDEKFDLKIRSVLEEGREDVPEFIWDGIRSRLDSSGTAEMPRKKNRRVLIWLRNTGAGLAAAAALTATVIFSGIFDSGNSPEQRDSSTLAVIEPDRQQDKGSDGTDKIMIAQATEKETSAVRDMSSSVPSEVTMAEMHEDGLNQAQDPITETPIEETAQEQTDKEPVKKEGPDTGTETERYTAEAENQEEDSTYDSRDFFGDDNVGERAGRKVRTALVISGNAISNTNSEKSDRSSMMAPGTISKTGFTEDGEGNSRFGIPISVGAGIRFSFTPKWSMSIGMNYSYLTRTFDGTFNDAETQTRTKYRDIRNSQHYIGIPVNFYYSILAKDFIDLYVYAGGAAECNVSNKYMADNAAGPLNYSGETGSMQLSANAGLGVEFLIADHVGLYIDPSLRYYFRNSKAPKSIRTVQPLMLGFEAGLRFRL